jgi:hypothetical protein
MLESEIKKKYLKQPSVESVIAFIKKLGVSYYQFERFYGMRNGAIKQFKGGFKPLPVKHWPIFYEHIVPQYGVNSKPQKPKAKKKTKKAADSSPQTGILSKLNDLTK